MGPEVSTAVAPDSLSARLLDREDALEVLDSAITAALAGSGRVVLIEGPPGIGKTALLNELRRRAKTRSLAVLSARGGELEVGFASGVIRQVFEPAIAGPGTEELFAGAARLAEPLFTGDQATEADATFATLHGLYWLTANLAERTPLLIVVDDVFWADMPSIRFLVYLAHRLDGLPVTLALACRSGADKQRPELRPLLLEAQPPVIRPQPLSEAAVNRIVRAALGTDAEAGLCREFVESTGGNPFLLAELLGEYQRREVRGAAPMALPSAALERIASAVLYRVEGIGFVATKLARAVAILGDNARLNYCAELAGIDVAEARAVVGQLAALDVLDRNDPVRFVHPVVRSAIYKDLSEAQRAALHSAAARLLRGHHGDPSQVAVHLMACDPVGDPDVVLTLREAAARALAGGAPDTAAALLRRALDEPPGFAERADILFELGRAEHEYGGTLAADHLREAGLSAPDPVSRARALVALAWNTHPDPARQQEQLALYEHAAREVEPLDRELSLDLHAVRLGGLMFKPGLASQFEDEAARFADYPANTAAECLLRSFVARRALAIGEPMDRVGALAEQSAAHPALVSQGGNPLWRANIMFCLSAAERYDRAQEILSMAVRNAEQKGSPQWLSRAMFMRAGVRYWRGDLRGAESDSRAVLEVGWLAGSNLNITSLAPLIFSLTDQGRIEECYALVAKYGLDGEVMMAPTFTYPLLARARLHAAAGNLASARADLEEVLRRIDRWKGRIVRRTEAIIALVPVLHALGKLDDARAFAREAVEEARRVSSRRELGGALRVSALLADRSHALELLQQAVEVLDESPSLLWRAEAYVDYGAALRRDGWRTEARRVLKDGLDLAHRCDAVPLAERAIEEMRLAGGRPRQRAQSGVASLTPGERRVAELAASGASNKEIAQSLFVTLRTVELHLSNAYAKLQIQSRHEIAKALAN